MLCGRCGCKGKKGKGKGKGRERKGKEGKGKEWLETDGGKKPLGMSELGCADGCGRQIGWGELRGRLRTAGVQKWLEMGGRSGASLAARTAADGVGAREWVEMGGEKTLGMSELGCARGCKGVAGNGWGEEAAGDERAWLHGRLRTEWLQGSGWKWVGRTSMENGCLLAGYVRI